MTERIEVPEWRGLVDRAKHLMAIKRPEDARQHAARAATMAPGEPAPLCLLAIATLELGQHQVALQHASRAIALAPEFDWPHRVRGQVLIEMKRYEDAIAAGKTAVRLAPTDGSGCHRTPEPGQ